MFKNPFAVALLALGLAPTLVAPSAARAQSKPALITLHRFDGTHGVNPTIPLTLGTDGNFYGVTASGGLTYKGTVFKMTPDGTFTTLWRFNGTNGADPSGPLVQGEDGAFYGTTALGGHDASGTAFRITPQGRLTTLHSFGSDNDYYPQSLAAAPDGTFYGVTAADMQNDSGDPINYSTVFHMTAAGAVTTLHTFEGVDGADPLGVLVFGPDGALYDTTQRGGSKNEGTVFRVTTDGQFSSLHSFTGKDGEFPSAGLSVGTDGKLYGTTLGGDINGQGVIYRIATAGKFSVLHKFSNDGHGSSLYTALTRGADGDFYGTTGYGGTTTASAPDGAGTVFEMTPAGQVTTLYKFHTALDGLFPGGVTFGADGALYGVTAGGGPPNDGTLYTLILPQTN